MSDLIVNIARDFSRSPGGQFKSDGTFSGEQFRDEVLVPKIKEAQNSSGHVVIQLDGTYGYASSFLDEAFGGLVRKGLFDRRALSHVLIFESTEPHMQYYKQLVEQFIAEAKQSD